MKKRSFIIAVFLVAVILVSAGGGAFARDEVKHLGPGDVVALAGIITNEFYEKTEITELMSRYIDGVRKGSEELGLSDPLSGIESSASVQLVAEQVNEALTKAGLSGDDAGVLVRRGLEAMVSGLSDEGCMFYEPGKYHRTLREMGYNKGGCGFFVDQTPDLEGRFIIIETLQDFPAEKGGVQAGDRIAEVDGKPVKGMTFYNLADVVRGPVGSNVIITVVRDGEYLAIPIRRTWLGPNPNSLRHEIIKGAEVGIIKFRFLGRRINYDLLEKDSYFKENKVHGIIWDMRNSSGTMEGALELSALFVPAGEPFVSKVFRDGRETFRGMAGSAPEKPQAIIINRHTDPSSALVAIILNKFAEVPIVGEPAPWKGDMTHTHRLSDGSAVSIVYGFYELSTGDSLKNDDPVKPTVEVIQPSVPPYGEKGDIQLMNALEVLMDHPDVE